MYHYLLIAFLFFISCNNMPREIQVSHDDSKNFDLDGRHNFSADDQWLVYDTRPQEGGIAACRTIEKINIKTGEVKVLYRVKNPHIYGPGAGAASYHSLDNKVIFIHGLDNCTEQRPYAFWRRSGLIVDEKQPVHYSGRVLSSAWYAAKKGRPRTRLLKSLNNKIKSLETMTAKRSTK